MKYLLVFLFCGCVLAGEEVLSPAEREYNASMEVLKKDFDKKANALREKLVTALKIQLAELTKRGDFDGAVKVKEKIIRYMIQSLIPTLVGKWDLRTEGGPFKAIVTFMADGNATLNNNNSPCPGKWTVDNTAIYVLWSTGHKYTFLNINDNEIICESTHPSSNTKARHVLRKINE